MKNQQQQQRALEVTEQVHGKESTELTADSSSGIDGSLITTATTPTVTTTTSTLSTLDQQAYEQQFIQEPTGGETTTTYDLFRSGDVFSEEAIRSKTHYIKNEISGQLWLDVDRNGKRGSFTDSTLNAIEQDSGVTGVDAIVLVDCDTNTEVAVTKSQPVRGDGEVVIQKVTETGGVAGGYRFPEVMNRPGRYYIVYKAPTNFRVNTNVLPTTEVKAERNGDGTLSYFECPMVGGEGGMFYDEAVGSGEFDYGGYCGRSVGCFEVGKKKDLEEKFENLVEGEESEYGPDEMVVVYPSEHMLDVGLSQQAWPLATQQYADIEVDLLFPQNSTEAVYTTLGETLESESALAESATVAEIQRTLLDSVMSIQGFSGVQLEVDGVTMSMVAEHQKNSEEKSEIFSRHLRSSSRKLQEEPLSTSAAAAASVSGYTVVTYKFTARGEYNPPPYLQLGQIAEQSINADSRRLTKTLREKIGDVFADLETVNSKHLTVKGYGDSVAADNSATETRPPPLETLNAQNAESRTGGLAPWATVPIILLAVLISGLVGLFFFRRAFSRRKVVSDSKDLEKKDEKYDYADEEAAAKGHGDNMDALMVDKAEDVPANMTGSGTDGSSGNSAEERNADSSERRRRKPRGRRSSAREVASSLKRSLTLQKEESVLSDITDTEEKRRKRKKAKEEARRLETEKEDDAEETSERTNSRRSSRRRSSGTTLRSSLRAAGEAVERRRRKKTSSGSSNSKPRRSSRTVLEEE